MANQIIVHLAESMETFLSKWSDGMERAAYLTCTSVKREDYIRSYWVFLKPMVDRLVEGREIPGFEALLQNEEGWANPLVEVARRHRFRGVTADMFFGCFKTLVRAIEEMILEMDVSHEEKLVAIQLIRRCSDAFETVAVGDWAATTQKEAMQKLTDANRSLTTEKNKYEHILEATSDVVLVTEMTGVIIEVNAAARRYLYGRDLLGRYFWEVLGLEGRNIGEVTHYYHLYEPHEIELSNGASVFNLRIFPLRSVSLISRGYMVLLTNVSCLVGQRELLEKRVIERTKELAETEKQYMSLFQAAGESILLVNPDLKVVEANRRSGQVFGVAPDQLEGLPCGHFCYPSKHMSLDHVIRNLDEEEIWEGELIGRRADGNLFPMAVTINRIDMDTRTLFLVLLRDVTKQKALEDSLRREKSHLEELNITLRNVMKTIDDERHEIRGNVARKINEVILPAMEKVENETDRRVRKGFFDVIRDQLWKLSEGGGGEQDARLLKLTPTEMKICQFVQAGSATKEIADSMGLSLDTVHTHRKNIRRKLGLRGRDINLYTFLNSTSQKKVASLSH